jgi:hypothetical protein
MGHIGTRGAAGRMKGTVRGPPNGSKHRPRLSPDAAASPIDDRLLQLGYAAALSLATPGVHEDAADNVAAGHCR